MIIDGNKNDKYSDDRYYYFSYNDQRVSYMDLSNMNQEGVIETINKLIKFFNENEFINLTHNGIVDCTGIKVNTTIVNHLKELTKAANSIEDKNFADKKSKVAILGLSKLQMIFLNALNQLSKYEMKAITTKEEALEWLIPNNS